MWSPPERQLLLDCATLGLKLDPSGLSPAPDLAWARVGRWAIRHNLGPSLFALLRDRGPGVPGAMLERLERDFYQSAFEKINIYSKLNELLAAFETAGIAVVVLKGGALASQTYENVALRTMGDLDLLVREPDLADATAALRALDYAPDGDAHPEIWYATSHHHLVPHRSADGTLTVELHRHIVGSPASSSIPVGELWRRARPARFQGREALVLHAADMLLHLALHLAHDDRFVGRLRALTDIAVAIDRHGEAIDWAALVDRAGRYRVEREVYYALRSAATLVEARVPASALADLGRSGRLEGAEHALLGRLIELALLHDPERDPLPAWLLEVACGELLRRASRGRKLAALAQRLLEAYRHSARQRGPTRAPLSWLYAVVAHPIVLLGRAVGRARTVRPPAA